MINNINIIDTNSNIDEEIEIKLLDIYKYTFIETAFSQRFQDFINEVRLKKKWAIVGAHSRNGKSWCIKDLVKNSGAIKEYNGITRIPVLAIRSPESNNASDIISSLCRCFGTLPKSNNSVLKKWLIDNIPNFGVEQLIIDDAHELNIHHFKFIKWLTDTLELEKNYYISVVLSSILSGNQISVWSKIMNTRSEDWMQQFYERFALFRVVQGHTPQEVAEVLYVYDELYKPFLSQINLIQWSDTIFAWLTHPDLDVHNCRRVAMEHLAKLIYESVRVASIQKMNEIPIDLLNYIAKLHLINRNKLYSTENEPVYKKGNTHKGNPQEANA
ncbi:AAA domain-containing protein [Natronincola peptidivorans]|uniref:AAA domain-containing protein n=1 Tax=Natronincola peptidivorans TaxID=426128 RepID=A0A1I0FWH4_9FIRM|nr:AAA family ATPase [Natronincola peptidivorans]SET61933.1 AAA domain-containing protein [Natronincola peptidivorans]